MLSGESFIWANRIWREAGLAGGEENRDGDGMTKHTWREKDEEGTTFYKATHHGGRWTMASQPKGEEDWIHYDPIPDEILERLRDVIYNKYQRGRCGWKLVAGIDKLLGRDSEEPKL